MDPRPLFSFARLIKPALVVLCVGGALAIVVYLLPKKENPKGSYGLGKLTVGEEAIHEFIIPNPFSEPLIISAVRSSHPDAQVASFDTSIPGHGKGLVRVSLKPTEPGELKAQFALDYGGQRRGLRHVDLHGDVVPPVLPVLPEIRPDPTRVISASELLALSTVSTAEAPVVVDLRKAEEFRRAHIPQSINMPSFQLKATQHLKRRPVIIVEEGVLSEAALETVSKLQAVGFSSVRILDGGLASWQALAAPMEGAERALPPMLSPAASLRLISNDGARVVDARTSSKPLPFAVPSRVVPMSSLINEVALAEFRQSVPPSGRVLILTDTGTGREGLRDFTAKMSGVPLFFVRGGAVGINREYIRMAQSAIKPSTVSVNGTATASNKRVTRSLGGCSSCP